VLPIKFVFSGSKFNPISSTEGNNMHKQSFDLKPLTFISIGGHYAKEELCSKNLTFISIGGHDEKAEL
jgi:hypothetical protein